MDPDILVEIIDSRLQDFAERLEFFLMLEDFRNAELIQNEWNSVLEAFHDNQPFLVLSVPEEYRA